MRPRAERKNVVRTVIDNVFAHPGMRIPAQRECEPELGADAIGAGDQDLPRGARHAVGAAEMADRPG